MDEVDMAAAMMARKRRIRMGTKIAESRRIAANKLLLQRWTAHYGTLEMQRRVQAIIANLQEEAPERLGRIPVGTEHPDYVAHVLYQQERQLGFLDIADAATIERTGAFRIQEQRIRGLVSRRAELFSEMMPIAGPLSPEQVAEYNRLLRTEGVVAARKGMAAQKALNWQMLTVEKVEDGVRVRSTHPFVAAGRLDAAVLDDVDAETLFTKIREIPELEGLIERAEARVESAFGMYEQLPLERQIATLQRHGIIEGWQPMAYRGLIEKRLEEAQDVVASHAPELREAFREQTARNIIRELVGERPMPLLRTVRGPLHAQAMIRGLEPEEQLRWLEHYGIISPEEARRALDLGEEGVSAAVYRRLPELEAHLGREGSIARWMRYQRADEPREGWKAWQWSVRHRLEILEAQGLMDNAAKNLRGAVGMFKIPEEILAEAAARPAGERIPILRAGLYERLGAKRAGKIWRRVEERRAGRRWRPTAEAFREEVQEYVRGGIERGLEPYEERLRQLGRVPEGVYVPEEVEPRLVREHLFGRVEQLRADLAAREPTLAELNQLSARRARRMYEEYQGRISPGILANSATTTAHPEVRRAIEELTIEPELLERVRAGDIPIEEAGTRTAYAMRWRDLIPPEDATGALREEGLGEALRRVDIGDIGELSRSHIIVPGVNDKITAGRILQSIRRYATERRLSMEEVQDIAQDAVSQIINLRERGVFHIEAGKAIIAPEHGLDIAANVEQYIRYRMNRRMQDIRRTVVTPEIVSTRLPGEEYLPKEVAKLIRQRKFAYHPEFGGALLGEIEDITGDVMEGAERVSIEALAEREFGAGLAEEVRGMFGELEGVSETTLAQQIATAETQEEIIDILAGAGIEDIPTEQLEAFTRQHTMFDQSARRLTTAEITDYLVSGQLPSDITQSQMIDIIERLNIRANEPLAAIPTAFRGFDTLRTQPKGRGLPETGEISIRSPLTQILGVPEEGPVWASAQRTRTITPGVGTIIEQPSGAKYKVVEVAPFEPFARGEVPWVVPVGGPSPFPPDLLTSFGGLQRTVNHKSAEKATAPMPYMRPEELERTMDIGEFNLFARKNLVYRKAREQLDRLLVQGDWSVALSPQQIEDLLQAAFTREEIDVAIRGELERSKHLAGIMSEEQLQEAAHAGLYDVRMAQRTYAKRESDRALQEMIEATPEIYAELPAPRVDVSANRQLEEIMEARFGVGASLEQAAKAVADDARSATKGRSGFSGESAASIARRAMKNTPWRHLLPLAGIAAAGAGFMYAVKQVTKPDEIDIPVPQAGVNYRFASPMKPDDLRLTALRSEPQPLITPVPQVPEGRGKGTRILIQSKTSSDVDERQFGHSIGRATASINDVPSNVRITVRDDTMPMNDRYVRDRIREALAA